MKKAVRYKKYICVVFAFLMIIIGICLCENQADSSFALRTLENAVLTLDRADAVLQGKFYIKEEVEIQNIINNRNRINIGRRVGGTKIQEDNLQSMSAGDDMIRYLHERDIRMCRTDNLTQVFNVIYIQHQNGVKGAGLCI